jgi:hypothetical protein
MVTQVGHVKTQTLKEIVEAVVSLLRVGLKAEVVNLAASPVGRAQIQSINW